VSHMTVGNEEYGTWETDLHSTPNDPTIYAAAVVGSSGYYDLIKAASPSTLVGVDVDASAGWDDTVLANAKGSYDFVEYHYYPETPGQENDTTLIDDDAQALTTYINTIKTELTKYGTSGTPIYVGEIGAPYSNPGKQSWSITQGLYAGQVLGEMMNDGVSRLTWWIGFGNCNGQAGNDSSSLYGWQDFGAYNIFSDGTTDSPADECDGNVIPIGTMSPTAEAFNLYQHVAVNGEYVLTPSITGDSTDVRAYAATHGTGTSTPGYALVLINRNETTPETVVVSLSGLSSSTDVSVETYDKEIYDYTNTNCALDPSCTVDPNHNYSTAVWAPPTTTDMGSQALPFTLTLQPWSMNVVIVQQ
jgi:alpha-L-arabinofuranosidase